MQVTVCLLQLPPGVHFSLNKNSYINWMLIYQRPLYIRLHVLDAFYRFKIFHLSPLFLLQMQQPDPRSNHRLKTVAFPSALLYILGDCIRYRYEINY